MKKMGINDNIPVAMGKASNGMNLQRLTNSCMLSTA